MTLYYRTVDIKGAAVFTPLSASDEATTRAAVVPDGSSGPLLFNDSGHDCVYSDIDAASIRAAWAAAPAKAAAVVPQTVLPRQIRIALSQSNLRAAVEAAVASADQATKDTWQYATHFERNHPMLLSVAASLGISSKQLDDLFRLAATL